jgi:glycosyltransferase involved in cell wall biosynthesis
MIKWSTISVICTVHDFPTFRKNITRNISSQTRLPDEIVIYHDSNVTAEYDFDLFRQDFDRSIELIVIDNAQKIGRAAALVAACALATSELVSVLDSDDIWYPSKLEFQEVIILRSKLDILATGYDTIWLTSSNFESEVAEYFLRKSKIELSLAGGYINQISLSTLLVTNPILHTSVLARKSALAYSISLKSSIDLELWIRSLLENKKIGMLNTRLAASVKHSNQNFESVHKRYIINSVVTRFRMIRDRKLSVFYYALPALKFLTLLMPRGLRLILKHNIRRVGLRLP